MATSEIKVYGLTSNPCGHALFASGGSFFIFFDIFHSRKSNKYSTLFYLTVLFFTVSLTFLVGFARFYIAVHTINQIIYGWSLGLWMSFYFHFCLRDGIMHHVDNHLLSRKTINLPVRKYAITNFIVMTATFMAQLFTYIIT